jgi:hypothetical protein
MATDVKYPMKLVLFAAVALLARPALSMSVNHACLCIGRRICQSEGASKQRSGYMGHCVFVNSKTRRAAYRCRRQALTISLPKIFRPVIEGTTLFCAQ